MAVRKSLEKISACQWLWIDCNQSLQPISSKNATFESHVETIYSVTDQPSYIVLNFKFSVLIFFRSWAAQWVLSKNCARENLSTPIYVKCDIDQRFASKNSGISCVALIFNLNHLRTTILYAKRISCRFQNRTSHYLSHIHFFFQSTDTNLQICD